MSDRAAEAGRYRTLGLVAAASTLLGILLSGPVALAVVQMTHPQPAWRDTATLAAHYHPIQMLPYAFGLLLVVGLVLLITAAHGIAGPELRPRTAAALPFAGAFAALIFFNYIAQTTFLPSLLAERDDRYSALIAALAMQNPLSLAWGIEMWGYAAIGGATWLVAPVFRGGRLETGARFAFVTNGPVSIAGGIATTALPGWVFAPWGYAAFGLWNALVLVMAILAWRVFEKLPKPIS